MKNVIFSTAFVAATAVATIASAGTFTATGVIEGLNTKTNTVRLVAGDAYRIPANVDLSGLSAGQKVHVSWASQNPASVQVGNDFIMGLQASSISAAN